MRVLQLLAEVVQPGQEVLVPRVREGAVTSVKDFLQFRIVQSEKLVQRQTVALYERELRVDGLLVDAE